MKPLSFRSISATAALLSATSTVASAQIDWVSFQEDPSRLSVTSSLGATDNQEKDYAWDDLDNDGWTDLVIVRKEPFTTPGRRRNVLLMNENGILTDRTSQYATASDASGDSGFLTNTNDRDVIIVDVNNDGWKDVVTATTLTQGTSKALSHPRIYMNLGEDGSGNWLGLRFEKDRTPQIKVNGSNYFPFFCGVGAGDVNGDGFADLYFADYDVAGFTDVNDRLFINDGTGHFTDESTSRMTTQMLKSPFGTSAVIADMNQDGVMDVVKNTGLGQTSGNPLVAISYNDPNNEGVFQFLDEPFQGNPYHVSTGDLNKDGKLDMIISDDAADRYMLNQGNDSLGRVQWSPAYTFQVSDDGFGSNNIIVDLDEDGWSDAIICDVDVDIAGCDRRMHIYHNINGNVGGTVTLKEEAGNGFRGVTGLTANAQRGTHDVAVFDIDNDGDKDMVVGRCTGTQVYMNLLYDGTECGTTYCGSDQNPNNVAFISIDTCSSSASSINVSLTNGPANQFIYLLVGNGNSTVNQPPGAKGDLCVVGGSCLGRYDKDVGQIDALGLFSTDIANAASNPCQGAVSLSPGSTWNFQYWHRQPMGQPATFSEAISVTFQ